MPEGNGYRTTPKVDEFARKLGLEPAVLHSLGLDDRGEFIAVPCRDRHGDLVNHQTRHIENGTKRWPKDSTPFPFGVDGIDVSRPLIVVEGAVDWILCRSMHLNVVGIPSATFTVDTEWLDEFRDVPEMIVLDEGGRAATNMIQTLAATEYADITKVFSLDGRDIYDVWKAEDSDAIAVASSIGRAIANAKPLAERLAPPPFEVLHESSSVSAVEWAGLNVTVQVTGRGRIDVRITDTDGRLLWRDDQPATDRGIRTIAGQIDVAGVVKTDASILDVISRLTYGILNNISDSDGAENLLTKPDADDAPLLISPLVVGEGASAVVGPSGSTKSINAVAVGLVQSSGQPIGIHEPSGEPSPVLILDGEANRRDLYDIASAIGRAHSIDIEALEREGLFRYRSISAPILGSGEQLRREVEKDGYKLLIVDSVDTARGPEAVTRSGEYYDTLRHVGIPSLSTDHVTAEMALRPLREYRAMSSIKSTNRPRQTWAMKATQKRRPELVTVRYRLNYTNRGQVGTEFASELKFEMDGGRFHRITLGEATAVERKEPVQYERVLIALLEADAGTSNAELQDLTDLTEGQVTKAIQTARSKSMVTPTGERLTVTASGQNHLITEWPNEMPEPKAKGTA